VRRMTAQLSSAGCVGAAPLQNTSRSNPTSDVLCSIQKGNRRRATPRCSLCGPLLLSARGAIGSIQSTRSYAVESICTAALVCSGAEEFKRRPRTVAGVQPVPVPAQMWDEGAQSRRRCGRGLPGALSPVQRTALCPSAALLPVSIAFWARPDSHAHLCSVGSSGHARGGRTGESCRR
jgi:hypothetical protein